ncbi:MAG TPA: N,N-dimethylformamidase beta subunit family domain-containing protein [Mycobacteriales bacterium]|nr:N,N-dimethylformamidase beta subunit family domain-containing protein [Mycobacteriales bacterium]
MPRRLAAAALLALAVGCSGTAPPPTPPSPDPAPSSPAATSPPSVPLMPTGDWSVHTAGPQDAIEGFTDRVSVLPGTPVRLYISTTATSYRIEAFRMGFYAGAWAARVWTSPTEPGRRQAGADLTGGTFTAVARWRVSVTVATTGWPAGDYLFRLDAANGDQRFVPLTLRSPSTAGRIVLLAAVTTWQAYNSWGGYSLYRGPNGFADRARVVSFDRPYAYGEGAADFVGNELPAVILAESLRLPVAYATDVELDDDPGLLDGARAVISMGHDEYYSQAMRDALTRARDRGVNLAFLGANAVYRHIRFAPAGAVPDRLEIDYKSFLDDPLHTSDPAGATGPAWRSPPDPRPESVLTGTYYQCNPVDADMVVADPGSWLLAGIVTPGEHLHRLVGSEYDAVDPSVPTPQPIEVLFHSPLTCGSGRPFADAAYYTTPSGAGVFDSGTSSWVCAIAVFLCEKGHGDPAAQRVVTAVTTRLLEAFAAGPAGAVHPARQNLARLGIAAPPVAPTR